MLRIHACRLLLATLVLFGASCTTISPPPADACTLLSSSDIRAAQGEAYLDATSTSTDSGGVTVAQCFYRLPNYADSVTIELTTPRDRRTMSTRQIWRQRFAARRDPDAGSDDEEREAEERREQTAGPGEPRRFVAVAGVGDEAAWTGNRVSGALYVRTAATVMRISVGGSGGAGEKVEKSKRLARAALSRLR